MKNPQDWTAADQRAEERSLRDDARYLDLKSTLQLAADKAEAMIASDQFDNAPRDVLEALVAQISELGVTTGAGKRREREWRQAAILRAMENAK